MTTATLADLERRFRANETRWDTVDNVLEPDKCRIIDECSEERDAIVRALERLPITSRADALLAMRLALDTVDIRHGTCRLDPEEDCDEVRGLRCLHSALCWLERSDVGRGFNPANLPDGLEDAITAISECAALAWEAHVEAWPGADAPRSKLIAFNGRLDYLLSAMRRHVVDLRRCVGARIDDDDEDDDQDAAA